MKDPPGRRPVGRPRDPRKTEAILDAAWSLFLERGVEAAPMEAVAARARVSKGTLYACFPDKMMLFEAALLREMERIEEAQGLMSVANSDVSLHERLTVFGVGIMNFLASETAISFYGVLSAEVRRHPDLSRAFWDLGPGRTRQNLAAILTDAAERRLISIGDPNLAADALFGLWQGFSNLRLALDVGAEEVRSTVADRVELGIAIFISAHSRRPAVSP